MLPQRPQGFWRRFAGQPVALASLAFLVLMALLGIAAPWLAEWAGESDGTVDLLAARLPPSAEHWLGTDELGRDFLIRLLEGGRISLAVALAAALGAALIGTVVGLVAGERGGWVDALLMRGTDWVIALPLLPLLIVLSAVDLTKLGLSPAAASDDLTKLLRLVVIVVLVGWTTTARLVRGATLAAMGQDYVRAARALGARPSRILFRHVLPNIAGLLVVQVTIQLALAILTEAGLSFLGIGVPPPSPSWGRMLNDSQTYLSKAPHLAVLPGLAIALAVLGLNMLGDGLRDLVLGGVTRHMLRHMTVPVLTAH